MGLALIYDYGQTPLDDDEICQIISSVFYYSNKP